MKKTVKVFDLPTFVKYQIEDGQSKDGIINSIKKWAYDSHGRTNEEMYKHGLFNDDRWCIDVEVEEPLMFDGKELKVGDCFVSVYGGFYKIKSLQDDYFMVDLIDEYGKVLLYGEAKWSPEEIEKMYTPKTTKEFKVGDTVKLIKVDKTLERLGYHPEDGMLKVGDIGTIEKNNKHLGNVVEINGWLYDVEDLKKVDTKELTVKEISDLLGYDVKIVK